MVLLFVDLDINLTSPPLNPWTWWDLTCQFNKHAAWILPDFTTKPAFGGHGNLFSFWFFLFAPKEWVHIQWFPRKKMDKKHLPLEPRIESPWPLFQRLNLTAGWYLNNCICSEKLATDEMWPGWWVDSGRFWDLVGAGRMATTPKKRLEKGVVRDGVAKKYHMLYLSSSSLSSSSS